jgi:RHS repeat-associated protein
LKKKLWISGSCRYDGICNRTSVEQSRTGAQASRLFSYSPNVLNQYTGVSHPDFLDVTGMANPLAAVTVNGLAATRQLDYFYKEVSKPNTSSPQWLQATISDGTTTTSSGALSLPAMQTSPSYDLDGNLTADSEWIYAWDAENRLIRVERTAAAIAAGAPYHRELHDYDYRSRRIRTRIFANTGTTPSSHILYIFDGWKCVAELSSSGQPLRKYTWGLDLAGSTGDTTTGNIGALLWLVDTPTAKTHLHLYDKNGNVTGLLDTTTRKRSATYDYDAFGQLISCYGDYAKLNPFTYSTKFTDYATGLRYYGYRWYGARDGRWLSRDPIEENGGFNLYGMVGNDGVNRVDFLGMRWIMKGTIDNDARRIWSRTNPNTDTLEQLASKVKLDPQESKKWAKQVNGGACEYSVPNVFLVSDLLGYDKADDALITTLGGRLGNLFTQATGKKKVSVNTVADMRSALATYRGNLWGFAVYAHGDPDGNLYATRRGNPITTASIIRSDLGANGFKLSKLWMMQCFSGLNGRHAWWQAISYREPFTYQGVNTCGIDVK